MYYAKVVNNFTGEFIQSYCAGGDILWDKMARYNSGDNNSQ